MFRRIIRAMVILETVEIIVYFGRPIVEKIAEKVSEKFVKNVTDDIKNQKGMIYGEFLD